MAKFLTHLLHGSERPDREEGPGFARFTLRRFFLSIALIGLLALAVQSAYPTQASADSPQADLSVTKNDAADPVIVGSPIDYTIDLTNNGPDLAQNVVLTDTLPAGVTFNFATITQGSCGIAFPLIVCQHGPINPGNSVTLTIRVTPHSPGTFTNTVEVTSDTADPNPANNTDSETTTVVSPYQFSGFFRPVYNSPAVNAIKAGASMPVKFSLGGDQGLSIFTAGYPVSNQVACGSGAPLGASEQTVTTGALGLSYDPATDTYTYIWKTKKSWAGTCRQFILRLVDGSDHIASFKFR
jgi:uncharacterized repeat protein (TIGR01451 family)